MCVARPTDVLNVASLETGSWRGILRNVPEMLPPTALTKSRASSFVPVFSILPVEQEKELISRVLRDIAYRSVLTDGISLLLVQHSLGVNTA